MTSTIVISRQIIGHVVMVVGEAAKTKKALPHYHHHEQHEARGGQDNAARRTKDKLTKLTVVAKSY